MPDILLIQPPIRDFYLTAKRTIPYGLACIASTLIKNGFSVEILDALATSKSRACELPPEMDYLRRYYPRPDRSGAMGVGQRRRSGAPGRQHPDLAGAGAIGAQPLLKE